MNKFFRMLLLISTTLISFNSVGHAETSTCFEQYITKRGVSPEKLEAINRFEARSGKIMAGVAILTVAGVVFASWGAPEGEATLSAIGFFGSLGVIADGVVMGTMAGYVKFSKAPLVGSSKINYLEQEAYYGHGENIEAEVLDLIYSANFVERINGKAETSFDKERMIKAYVDAVRFHPEVCAADSVPSVLASLKNQALKNYKVQTPAQVKP